MEEWVKCEQVFKRYKLSFIKYVSHGYVIYSMVMVVNNTIYSKVAKWVDLKRSHHTHKNYNYGDVCELLIFLQYVKK